MTEAIDTTVIADKKPEFEFISVKTEALTEEETLDASSERLGIPALEFISIKQEALDEAVPSSNCFPETAPEHSFAETYGQELPHDSITDTALPVHKTEINSLLEKEVRASPTSEGQNKKIFYEFVNKEYKCIRCLYETVERYGASKHFEGTHLEDRKMKCNDCNSENGGQFAEDRGQSALTAPSDTTRLQIGFYKCSLCDYKAVHDSRMANHIKGVHLKIKNFECDHCSYKTSYKGCLYSHIQNVHLKVKQVKKFECDQCSFKAPVKAKLLEHVRRVHLKTKEFKCIHCHVKTSRKWNLRAHIKRVHGDS